MAFSMSSARRRLVIRHPVVVDVGCSCRRPKLPSFFYSLAKPKSAKSPRLLSPSTATSISETLTSSTIATTTSTATITTTATVDSSPPSRYGDFASSSSSSSSSSPFRGRETGKGKKKGKRMASRKAVVEGSTAVAKDSSDPYLDFRDSMLQMIVEMEIYAWDDLRDLLHRFLALNAVCHHHLIFRAFAEIWTDVFTATSPPPPTAADAAATPRSTEKAQKRMTKVEILTPPRATCNHPGR